MENQNIVEGDLAMSAPDFEEVVRQSLRGSLVENHAIEEDMMAQEFVRQSLRSEDDSAVEEDFVPTRNLEELVRQSLRSESRNAVEGDFAMQTPNFEESVRRSLRRSLRPESRSTSQEDSTTASYPLSVGYPISTKAMACQTRPYEPPENIQVGGFEVPCRPRPYDLPNNTPTLSPTRGPRYYGCTASEWRKIPLTRARVRKLAALEKLKASKSSPTFLFFPWLPTELREIIWKYACTIPRIAKFTMVETVQPNCASSPYLTYNGGVPSLLSVNSESRGIARKEVKEWNVDLSTFRRRPNISYGANPREWGSDLDIFCFRVTNYLRQLQREQDALYSSLYGADVMTLKFFRTDVDVAHVSCKQKEYVPNDLFPLSSMPENIRPPRPTVYANWIEDESKPLIGELMRLQHVKTVAIDRELWNCFANRFGEPGNSDAFHNAVNERKRHDDDDDIILHQSFVMPAEPGRSLWHLTSWIVGVALFHTKRLIILIDDKDCEYFPSEISGAMAPKTSRSKHVVCQAWKGGVLWGQMKWPTPNMADHDLKDKSKSPIHGEFGKIFNNTGYADHIRGELVKANEYVANDPSGIRRAKPIEFEILSR